MEEFETPTPEAEPPQEQPASDETVSAEDLLAGIVPDTPAESEDVRLRALLEAVVYITDEPLTLQQMSAALAMPPERIRGLLDELVAEYEKPGHGLTIREVAGGYKMATKPEHHEAVRNFVKSLKPPLKLSLAALETLAVIAYKQPVTAPEIGEIRGVQGTGVLKTLLDRKLIAAAGRKNVIGKPILYKTTKEFLVQFGLKDLSELPTLKEFEEIGRMALGETEGAGTEELAQAAAAPETGAAEATPVEAETSAEPVAAEPEPTQAETNEPAPAETGSAEPAEAGEITTPSPDPRPPVPGEPPVPNPGETPVPQSAEPAPPATQPESGEPDA